MKRFKFLLAFTSLFMLLGLTSFKSYDNNDKELRDTDLIIISDDTVSNNYLLNEVNNIVGYNYRKINEFNGAINGIEIAINNKYIDQIKKMNGVLAASKNNKYVVNSINEQKTFDSGKEYDIAENDSIIEMNLGNDTKEGEGLLVAVLDTSFSSKHNAFTNLSYATKKKITKAKISKLNLHAKEPQYVNDKIPFMWDYGGSGQAISGKVLQIDEDNDVETLNSYHGMHVSSILCANSNYMKGVAPKAQLAFMKVFCDVGSSQVCYDSYIFNALNDCYELGVDIVNLSLGEDFNETTDNEAGSAVIAKLGKLGVQVNCAQGNSGKDSWKNSGTYANDSPLYVENGIVGGYATLKETTSIASSRLSNDDSIDPTVSCDGKTVPTKDQVIIDYSAAENQRPPVNKPFLELLNGEDSIVLDFEIIPNLGKEEDYNDIDVNGKVAVIQRGEITFVEKIKHATNHGAIATIIYNNDAGDALGGFNLYGAKEEELVPTLMTSLEAGKILLNSETKKIHVSKQLISDFSSNGPTSDLRIKPEISAPGENIIGAINVTTQDNNYVYTYDKYIYSNGTSMATPNYSGAVATIMSSLDTKYQRDEYLPTLKARIMSTATTLKQTNGSEMSVRRQGAGVVNINNALSGMYLTYNDTNTAKAELKNNSDIKNGIIDFDVVIHNENNKTGKYNASLSVTIPEIYEADSANQKEFKNQLFQTTSQTLLDKYDFEIELNGESKQSFNVHYELSEDDKLDLLSIFENGLYLEGFISLRSDDLPSLNMPYLGFFGDFDNYRCVEEFDFEKEDNKLYESAVLNSLLKETGMRLPNANFESSMVTTSLSKDSAETKYEQILRNKINIKELFDPIDAIKVDEEYYLFIDGSNTTLIIQQMVNRNIKDNEINIFNDKNKNVYNGFLIDSMITKESVYHRLNKSIASDSYIKYSGGSIQYYIASRAYQIIDLSNFDDGTYKLEFVYDLINGTRQTYTYNLVVNKEGNFDKSSLEGVNVSSEKIDVIEEMVATSTASSTAGYETSALFFDARDRGKEVRIIISDTTITFSKEAAIQLSGKFTYIHFSSEKNKDDYALVLDIALNDNKGKDFSFDRGIATISTYFNNKAKEDEVAKLYYLDGEELKEVNATFENNYLTFTTTHFSTFVVKYEKVETPDIPDIPDVPEIPTTPYIEVKLENGVSNYDLKLIFEKAIEYEKDVKILIDDCILNIKNEDINKINRDNGVYFSFDLARNQTHYTLYLDLYLVDLYDNDLIGENCDVTVTIPFINEDSSTKKAYLYFINDTVLEEMESNFTHDELTFKAHGSSSYAVQYVTAEIPNQPVEPEINFNIGDILGYALIFVGIVGIVLIIFFVIRIINRSKDSF